MHVKSLQNNTNHLAIARHLLFMTLFTISLMYATLTLPLQSGDADAYVCINAASIGTSIKSGMVIPTRARVDVKAVAITQLIPSNWTVQDTSSLEATLRVFGFGMSNNVQLKLVHSSAYCSVNDTTQGALTDGTPIVGNLSSTSTDTRQGEVMLRLGSSDLALMRAGTLAHICVYTPLSDDLGVWSDTGRTITYAELLGASSLVQVQSSNLAVEPGQANVAANIDVTFACSAALSAGDIVNVFLGFAGDSSLTGITASGLDPATASYSSASGVLSIQVASGGIAANQAASMHLPAASGNPIPISNVAANDHRFTIEIQGASVTTHGAVPFDSPPAAFSPATFSDTYPSWAQLIGATQLAYLSQAEYNDTTWSATTPKSADDFVINIKPPPRTGHSLNAVSTLQSGTTYKHQVLMFGGKNNGTRNLLWVWRPGMQQAAGSSDSALRDITSSSRQCAASAQSTSYAHVCNSWSIQNSSLYRKVCESEALQQHLLRMRGYCVGQDYDHAGGLALQECTGNVTQRIFFVNGTSALTSTHLMLDASLDQFGTRSGKRCVHADLSTATLQIQPCSGAAEQNFTLLYSNSGTLQLRVDADPSKCLAFEGSTSSDLPGLRYIDYESRYQALVMRACSTDETMHFTWFSLVSAMNECTDHLANYDATGTSASGRGFSGSHVGRFAHGSVVLSPDPTYDEATYGKLAIFSGRDFDTGYLADVWTYDVNARIWTQLFDGGSYQVAPDTHIHAQYEMRLQTPAQNDAGISYPRPRSDASVVRHFVSEGQGIVKNVTISEIQSVATQAAYATVYYKVGENTSNLVFPDTDTSVEVARTRDFGLFRHAHQEYGWTYNSGAGLPYTFTYARNGSIINSWRVTLNADFTITLVRPTEYITGSDSVVSDDRFVTTTITTYSTYDVTITYTCSFLSAANIESTYVVAPGNTLPAITSCNQDATGIVQGIESYSINELQLTKIIARGETRGFASALMFGGWVTDSALARGSDGGSAVDDLWRFSYRSHVPNSFLSYYKPVFHDSPYHTFPCCGSVQTCCGTSADPRFAVCSVRRLALQAAGACNGTCCGSLPTPARWTKIRAASYLHGKPAARYGHTATTIGTPSVVNANTSSAYRMLVFGGRGAGLVHNDLWSLSLEESPTQEMEMSAQLVCSATTGSFVLSFSQASSTAGVTIQIMYNETAHSLRHKIEAYAGVLNAYVNISGATESDATICGDDAAHVDLNLTIDNAFESSFDIFVLSSALNRSVSGRVSSGYAILAKTSQLTYTRRKFVWALEHAASAAASSDLQPARRYDHASTTYNTTTGVEVMVIYGGFDGSDVLRDLWVFHPHASWGQVGTWHRLHQGLKGSYQSCRPTLFMSMVSLLGFSCTNMTTDQNLQRRDHSLVAISSAFAASSSESPQESLFTFGGASAPDISRGNNWNHQGWPFGGNDPDTFVMCLRDSGSPQPSYCGGPISLGN